MRWCLLTVVLAVACGGDGDGSRTSAASVDPGLGFANLVPPGQKGVLNALELVSAELGSPPAHVDDQLRLYDALILDDATPGMTVKRVLDYFKDASFVVPPDEIARSYSPGGRSDVVVVRDRSFGVPHVLGTTREGAMFGQGYATAEDRLFLMDALRHVGRAELAVFLGASAANLAMDAEQLAVAPYTEADLVHQIEDIRSSGPVGVRIVADAEAYLAGVNQYVSEALLDPTKLPAEYPALQLLPEVFVPEDVVAIASLVGGIFGRGGGREVANYCGIEAIAAQAGAARAREIFDDLKHSDEPDAPVTASEGVFPYPTTGATNPAAVPDVDCDSLRPIAPGAPDPAELPAAVIDLLPALPLPGLGVIDLGALLELPLGTSNALLVTGDRTESGRPIAVFGPQTGYRMPQLLVEKSVVGPGIRARGVAFAGSDLYVQLGHGEGYAWSATSAGADNTDQFVLRLCEPGGGAATITSMGYLHEGACKRIESVSETKIAKPSAGGIPDDPTKILVVKHFERAPDYGAISARGRTQGGAPIAIATRRSTYGAELASARGFAAVNDPDVMSGGVEAFRTAFGEGVDYTFNWFYVDAENAAYQHSCKCPVRAAGVDPDLPSWGTGEWDWTGFLPLEAQPTATDPESGYLVSWNNKQARGFAAADDEFDRGVVHRSLMLSRRIEAEIAEGPVDVGEAIDVMALAATVDLRAQEILPLALEILGASAPAGVDGRAPAMRDRLAGWNGHRRDHDGDGAYDDAHAPAIMDAWWPRIYDAIFRGPTFDARAKLGFLLHDPPQGHQGSAFLGAAYSHVAKALMQALGRPLTRPFSRSYCGDGDLVACRTALWTSLSTAAIALEAEFGSAALTDWRRTPADDAIHHVPVGVATVDEIDWQNRPTFQQVVEVGTRFGGRNAR